MVSRFGLVSVWTRMVPLWLAGCAALAGTPDGPKSPGPAASSPLPISAWKAPATRTIQLLAGPFTYAGEKSPGDAALVRWSGERLAAWKKTAVGDNVLFSSPELGPEMDAAVRMRITLRSGGARKVHVLPVLAVVKSQKVQPNIRGFEIPLPPDAGPDSPVTLEADVKETLRGNWADESGLNRLQRIEITLPRAILQQAELVEVRFDGEAAVYAHAAAGTAVVDREGILRPALFLHPGASARVTVDLPHGNPELRWHDAVLGEAGQRSVSVIVDGVRTSLAQIDGSQAGWVAHSAALSRWAGKRVTFELSAADATSRLFGVALGKRRQGVGFFGAPRVVSPQIPKETPDVIVYLIDMLRADHLGTYGSTVRGVSPFIDQMAKDGVVFNNAISSSNWTKPAIPTLLAGLWETTHRVGANSYTDKLPEGVPMIQERFRNAGWRTVSLSANPLGSTLSGLARGFDTAMPPRFWKGKIGPLGAPAADQLQDSLFEWIDQEPDQPIFAYLHTMEVHRYLEPLFAHPPAGLSSYDMALMEADRKLGRMLERWATLPRGRDLLLVLVADHGHSLGEHGKEGHGLSMYQPEIHIPLIFWAKGSLAPRRIDGLAGLADLAPTLTDLFHIPALPSVQGVTLVPMLTGARKEVHEFLPSALLRFVRFPDAPQQFAVVTSHFKKCIKIAGGETNLFDLATDPAELNPVPPGRSPVLGLLETWIVSQKQSAAAFREKFGVESEVIDAEQVERLRSLGYVQ